MRFTSIVHDLVPWWLYLNHKFTPLPAFIPPMTKLDYFVSPISSFILKHRRKSSHGSSPILIIHNPPNKIPKHPIKITKTLFPHKKTHLPTPINSQKHKKRPIFTPFTSLSSPHSTELTNPPENEPELDTKDEKFDWYAQWYPIMPVCDLDKRAPQGKKIMGIDIVVWWDKNESEWKVFDDMCPHRLAPLSEGRIDQWGRLQCVYHGWCFGGAGDCKFIPQAPEDGPPVHTSKKACVAVYPNVVQNDIVWFWPNTDPQYSDILSKKRPPYIPELDDPSFTRSMSNRDIPYGYDVLIDNLMDPAHVNYAHYGIMRVPKRKESVKADREGGQPMEINVEKLDVNGYKSNQGYLNTKFMAPCVFYAFPPPAIDSSNGSVSSAGTKEGSSKAAQRKFLLIFICVPVSPGKSRLIFSFPRNFALWADKLVPRWVFHLSQNLVLDSDLYLLHAEERKLMEVGPSNWHKACFVPTKADAQVVAFRKWLNKYAGGQVDWRTKFSGALPPSPPREQLMDRYWSHVVNCRSCSVAYKGLNALEVVLQVVSVALIGIVAATKQNMLSVFQRNAMISVAVICFVGSRWLSHFIYKNFRFHDYNHAFR